MVLKIFLSQLYNIRICSVVLLFWSGICLLIQENENKNVFQLLLTIFWVFLTSFWILQFKKHHFALLAARVLQLLLNFNPFSFGEASQTIINLLNIALWVVYCSFHFELKSSDLMSLPMIFLLTKYITSLLSPIILIHFNNLGYHN